MIKIFRRVRQKLLAENRMTRYVIYALGEILLVIIGILLALLINDWRNQQQEREIEKTVLSSLELEFEETKTQIEEFIRGNEEIIKTADQFVIYCNESKEIEVSVFDSLLVNTAWHTNLTINQGVLSEMLNTGKLSIISNTKTRVLLSSWTAILENTKEREIAGSNYLNTMVVEYLDKTIPWAEMTKYDKVNPKNIRSGRKDIDRNKLAKDMRLENFAINQAWFCKNQVDGAQALLDLNIKILDQMKSTSKN